MTDKRTAICLLKRHDITLTEAACLVSELLEESGETEDKLAHCRRVIRLGTQAVRQEKATVSFEQAVEITLEVKSKQQRASRTLADIRYYMRRLMRECAGLAERPLRAMTTAECTTLLERVYPTPAQRRKARAILSGVFRTAQRRGWCGENPIRQVDIPTVRETEITPLSLPEVERLLSTAQQENFRDCLPALGIMLYAGVRPEEVTRLCWQDIDEEEQEIIIRPRHSKTGGGRHIAIYPPLRKLLKAHNALYSPQHNQGRICPRNWRMRWKQLRHTAGFRHWVPDVLRHTFASYYVKQYRDMNTLQLYMGHRNLQLLFTRYVNLRNISQDAAERFWQIPAFEKKAALPRKGRAAK